MNREEVWDRSDDRQNIPRTYMKYVFRQAWAWRKRNYKDLYKITDRKARLNLYCDVDKCGRHALYAVYGELKLYCEKHVNKE